ncbi:MAG: aminoacyltransferase [Ignavibacteriales bacterium]|nr:aminoacyltransferase [Ignavibacteriales bacterium]
MPEVNLTDWNRFSESHPETHLLANWASGANLKRDFGWKPVRIILTTKLARKSSSAVCRLGLTIGYIPKPVFSDQSSVISEQFWKEVDSVCKQNHAIFLKIEPDSWSEEFTLHTARVTITSSFPLITSNLPAPS